MVHKQAGDGNDKLQLIGIHGDPKVQSFDLFFFLALLTIFQWE